MFSDYSTEGLGEVNGKKFLEMEEKGESKLVSVRILKPRNIIN